LDDQRSNAISRFILSFPQKKKTWHLPFRATAAAAAILLIGFAWFSYHHFTHEQVSPGSNRATLTDTYGQQIELNDEAEGIAYSEDGFQYIDGRKIKLGSEKQGPQLLTLQTPRGGQYKIQLPDGTVAYLNAASSLQFLSDFAGEKIRAVRLEGEAFFDVTKDDTKPFVVHSEQQQIRVLGTQFMVSSYIDDNTVRTILLEGHVAVSSHGQELNLLPNQLAVLEKGKLSRHEIEASEEIAWIHGEFVFNKETLESIMRKLSRWYDITVDFDDPSLKGETYEGVVNRFDDISIVLRMFSSINENVKFKMDGKTLLV
jgi:hypothetical protein